MYFLVIIVVSLDFDVLDSRNCGLHAFVHSKQSVAVRVVGFKESFVNEIVILLKSNIKIWCIVAHVAPIS